ncbi:hypothetical protein OG874_40330 [Nocardia sp. NBC_00565]|uniref:hypothetical protein n=1 Tax=Nocardia sp. NBC_00565 TaxID=2975993 RepID=UPI002E805C04|nr:hypothetical protein [Nocardia sp. NBC_00565]WUC02875.1 hypothetical protein OG874_40330 [Nocardia sp. NBC_00565]
MNAPLDPSIVDLLRGSALAPLVDRPVNDILRDMGLGPLPNLSGLSPLPELPPLPVIDLAALARPLTDMASGFGTGNLGATAGGGPDPTKVLADTAQAAQTAIQLGTQALQTVMSLWQGLAAMQAANKAGQAADNGAELATQSAQEKATLAGGATSVATGGAMLAAVIAKYTATVTAASPWLVTGAGQAFIAAATVEAITEGVAVVTKTRIEMTGHSANMTAAGKKVKVTNAPTGVDSMQQVMQLLTPLLTMAQTGAQTLTQVATQNATLAQKLQADTIAKEQQERADKEEAERTGSGAAAGGGGGGGAGVGGIGAAPISTPLSPWTGPRTAGLSGMPGFGASGTGSTAVEPAAVRGTTGAPGSPGMMPYGAAGAGARGAGDAGGDLPGFLVNADHGEEVVGPIEGVSLPVVGAAEQISEPPPDRELTL